MMRIATILLSATLALPATALACEPPPPAKAGLTIEPTVQCHPGHSTELIRLSRTNGDAIDGVFAFCRDPSLSSEAWIQRLETTRDKLIAGTAEQAGKDAIHQAFAAHIARERATNQGE